jgi:hypothetical protein
MYWMGFELATTVFKPSKTFQALDGEATSAFQISQT